MEQERVVAYGSKMPTKKERNYLVTRQELLAMVHFVNQFKHFLLGCKFLIRMDNSAVRYWMRIHSDSYGPQGQVAHWMVKLAAFDFEINHRTGKQHGNTDGMSRYPLLQCAQSKTHHPGAFETKRGKKVEVARIE